MEKNFSSLFFEHDGRYTDKYLHYFEIYDRHFSRFRGKKINFVEIGVQHGGSLEIWQKYFGEKANIYGIDIDEKCKKFENNQVKIFIGDQSDKRFLKTLKQQIPKIDILLDDGGHKMRQQITTFNELFTHIDENGVYLCEDLHTSYWNEWEGGYLKKESFIELTKNLIDQLNAWHSQDDSLKINEFTKSAYSLSFYDSVVVIEKRKKEEMTRIQNGSFAL